MAVLPIGIGSAAGAGGFNVERSLRFNSADSAHLNRTLGTSNRRTFTFSAWLKRSVFASTQCIFGNINYAGGGSTNQQFYLGFTGSDQLDMFHYNNGTQNQVTSSAVYRDPSAWYHIVGAVDTTQATSSNRLKIYVNGSQITALATATYPAQNTDTFINANLSTGIGRQVGTGITGSYYNDGYLTEIYFIDGQALTPSSFGETDSNTGVWKPKAFSGTYGTNGFYLKFADNSGTTSTTLGKDSSGNGNNWTPNNFSVTAGAGNDSLVDSPTAYGTDTGVGGEVRGNYCTLNPLSTSSLITASNGNLNASSNQTASTGYRINSTFAQSSGKWYFEVTNTSGASTLMLGVGQGQITNQYPGQDANSWGYHTSGLLYNNSSTTSTTSASSVNDVIGVAFDIDAGKIWFSVNGTFLGSGNPSAGTNPAFTGLSGSLTQMVRPYGTTNADVNFGQRPFAYTAPSGFKALCTQNLPTPTIGATSTTQANRYFDVVLRNGFGSSGGSITSLNFQPDFWWEKARNNTYSHQWLDIIRGVGATGYSLSSNSTTAEVTQTNYLLSFNSNGYTLGTNDYSVATTLVDWCWKGGGTGVTNTAGTITSTVSANTTSGFSIGTYDATGSAGSIGHGLGAVPKFIIIKNRYAANSWAVYHASVGTGQQLLLNSTGAISADAQGFTAVSSTTFSVGTGAAMDTNQTNASSPDHVFYAWAEVAGYSAFGSYTGNGSADGPFVHLGFRPKFFMTKRTNGGGDNWHIHDTTRSEYNIAYADLRPNTSDAENTSAYPMDILSNGIKWRQGGSDGNESGATYIYAAFAETPAKFSLAR